MTLKRNGVRFGGEDGCWGLMLECIFFLFLFNFLVKCSADGGEQKAADEQQARRGGVARWRGGEEGGQTAYQEFSLTLCRLAAPSAGCVRHFAASTCARLPSAFACPL